MNRIFLSIGILNIYWYSIFILLGVLTAIFIIYRELKRQKVDTSIFIDMAFNTVICGILGARIYYVLFNLEYYLKTPLEIVEIWNGGLAIHGAIIFGSIYIFYYCYKNKLNAIKMLDIIAVGLIIAQAIGRWGNFFNQEAYGPVTTLVKLKQLHIPIFIINGMKISGTYYMPTFLYESLWNIIGFIVLIVCRKLKKIRIGQLSGIYLSWYSIGRFYIESLRQDSLMLNNLKIAQIISIILFLIGILLIIQGFRKNKYYNEKGIEENDL